jgi:hypothetical protein
VPERLDEERLEILRAWGVGLSTDGREELRAAGKAIALLVDEIDRLHVELWHLRVSDAPARPEPASASSRPSQQPEQDLSTSLRERLGSVLPSLSARNDP